MSRGVTSGVNIVKAGRASYDRVAHHNVHITVQTKGDTKGHCRGQGTTGGTANKINGLIKYK